MALIPVKAKGRVHFAQVSEEDFARLSKYKWYLSSNGYAFRVKCYSKPKKSSASIYMHWDVCGPVIGEIDHIDRNKINNTRANLRPVTPGQNMANRARKSVTVSGFKGVFKNSIVSGRIHWKGVYRAQHLGSGYGEEFARELAMRYDLAAIRDIGLSAELNFPIQRVG